MPSIEELDQEILELKKKKAAAEAEAKGWYGCLSRSRITAIVGLARGIMRVDASDFDAHPDLLNTNNGVIDLTTGELGPHDPDLLFTKAATADYIPGATHPDWDAALEAVPADVRDWYQIRLGQAITGHMTPDDLLVVQQGGGENGKSTIAAAVAATLGSYYTLISHRVLLANPNDHPTELMDLRGARLALVEETPEERRLNVTRLKTVVGTSQITARYIRQDSVTFDASHSLFLSTNYLPVVEETDHGTWRRLACLRFPYRWLKPGETARNANDRVGDPTLRQRLTQGGDGRHEAVLAWLVDGAVKWYQAGRIMPQLPERVVRDTWQWRTECDLILGYISERLVFDPDAMVMSQEMLLDVNNWLSQRGQRAFSDRGLASRFGGHSEIVAHGVEKMTVRHSSKLSRRPERGGFEGDMAVPAMYKAWLGIRFRTLDELAQIELQALSGAPSGPAPTPSGTNRTERDSLGVTDVSINPGIESGWSQDQIP